MSLFTKLSTLVLVGFIILGKARPSFRLIFLRLTICCMNRMYHVAPVHMLPLSQ